MSHLIFTFIILLVSVLRLPLSIVFVLLRSFSPFIKMRLDFERKNLNESTSSSFIHSNQKADLTFLVSSEGELEQSRALIEKALSQNKLIEIIYSSPSVEGKCQKIFESHKVQVRLLRLPILSASPFTFLYFQNVWQWVSSDVIIFCRYDFFPELLALKFFNKKMILISGAFKKMSWYKRQSFSFFSYIVAATDTERKKFQDLLKLPNTCLKSCDLRIPRIIERKNLAEITLQKKAEIRQYIQFLNQIPKTQKIIFGSAWASDLELLNRADFLRDLRLGKIHLTIVPHKLDDNFVLGLKQKIDTLLGTGFVEIINEQNKFNNSPIVILQVGGVLCELYSHFQFAYIGGGYERSIHSVLEPFFMGCAVVVGPKIERSTEFDLVKEVLSDEIHVLNSPKSFYTLYMDMSTNTNKTLNLNARSLAAFKMQKQMEELFNEIIHAR